MISGFADLDENCFFSVNSTVAHNIKIGKDCWISPGVVIMKNVEAGPLFKATKTKPEEITAIQYFKVEAEDVTQEEHGCS